MVYYANYLRYFERARTEFLRTLEINDKVLEGNHVMMPVIHVEVDYLKPLFYDDMLRIETQLRRMPETRLHFSFKIFNAEDEITTRVKTTSVFVDALSRKPMRCPEWFLKPIEHKMKNQPIKIYSHEWKYM